MRYFILLPVLMTVSACAGPITAWKGRAYGEHSLEPNELVTMSSTFRNARTATIRDSNNIERTTICFEPHSEVAALMSGATTLGYSGASLGDDTDASLVKGHEPSGPVQLAALYQSISCNAWIDGVISLPEYQRRTRMLLNGLMVAMTTPPAAPAEKEKEKEKEKE